MTSDLEAHFRQRLQDSGLLPFFDEHSQFLEFPSGFFVDVVVKDGTKLPEFRRVVDQIRAEAPGRLDAIVRAIWEVEKVGDPEPAHAADGGLRAAERYPVELRSGAAHQQAWVEVTLLAKLSFRDHGIKGEEIRNIVGEFVNEQLEKGGASYWDPVRSPNLEISGDTARQIVSRSLLGKKAV